MDNSKCINQNIKPLNTKINEKGNLEISGCDVVELAKNFKTPLYVMDEQTLVKMANDYKKAFSKYENIKIHGIKYTSVHNKKGEMYANYVLFNKTQYDFKDIEIVE